MAAPHWHAVNVLQPLKYRLVILHIPTANYYLIICKKYKEISSTTCSTQWVYLPNKGYFLPRHMTFKAEQLPELSPKKRGRLSPNLSWAQCKIIFLKIWVNTPLLFSRCIPTEITVHKKHDVTLVQIRVINIQPHFSQYTDVTLWFWPLSGVCRILWNIFM